jgi:uncharacterized protein (DUF58 family)
MSIRDHLLEGETAARRYSLAVPRGGPASRSGTALGSRPGSSLEFRDYRGYEPGDDLRHIDWNAYARNDQLSVKLYREEVTPHLDLLLDGSRSMALEGTAKGRASTAIAGLFAAAAANAGFSHSGWLLQADAQPLGSRQRNTAAWERMDFVGAVSPAPALLEAAAQVKPRGVRVLVSDLLWLAEPARIVRQLADRAAGLIVLQVLAAVDAEPPYSGHLQLIDSETNELREVRVDAERTTRYRDNLARLQGHWHEACRAVGAVFATVIAESLVSDWRLDDLVAAGVLQVGP